MRAPRWIFVLAALAGAGGAAHANVPDLLEPNHVLVLGAETPGRSLSPEALQAIHQSLLDLAADESFVSQSDFAASELPTISWEDLQAPTISPAGQLMSYDLLTGRESTVQGGAAGGSATPMSESPSQWTRTSPSGGGLPGDVVPSAFPELERVISPGSSSYFSRHVKVVFQFGQGTSSCSGTMIDSFHVLTAGHCVYSYERQVWASNVVVVPALDSPSEPPYHSARGMELWAWSAWMYNRDFNHDVGLIRLNRPVGGATGWQGYGGVPDPIGWGFEVPPCSNVPKASSGFNVPGYPGEYPYSGLQMYNHHGTWDACTDGYIVNYYGPAIGGQSGSGVINADNIAFAVMTHDVRFDNGVVMGGHTIINASKFQNIAGQISGHRPPAFDLVPLMTRIGRDTYETGETLEGLSVLLHNLSLQSATTDLSVAVHLVSTSGGPSVQLQPLLTTAPSLFPGPGTRRYTSDGQLEIPHSLVPGDYLVVVEVSDPSDSNPANNFARAPDTALLTVTRQTRAPLEVDFAGGGAGEVQAAGELCYASCTVYVDPEAPVTLTASAHSGNRHLVWEGCTSSAGATCHVDDVTQASGVKVWFVEDDAYMCVADSFLGLPYGDVDADGAVTSGDALLVLRHSRSLQVLNGLAFFHADANGDARVTDDDAQLVLNRVVGEQPESPHVLRASGRVFGSENGNAMLGVSYGETHCVAVFNLTDQPAPEAHVEPVVAGDVHVLTLEYDPDKGTVLAVVGGGSEGFQSGVSGYNVYVGADMVGVIRTDFFVQIQGAE
ncbi:MAG: trypsin-like serine protease [Trueperaceae bacterium]